MKALCIIPARGGSKRIPRKNIRTFHGRPILAYPVEAARDSGCFDEIMVSTDDPEIAAVARACGANVPFLRSPETSHDHAGSEEVIDEVIRGYRTQGLTFTHVCALYPTAALATPAQLRRGLAALEADPSLAGVLSVQRFSFPVQRALVFRNNRLPLLQPEHYQARSQDLEPAFHDAGQWYWLRCEPFVRTRELMGPNFTGLVLSETEAQDIDNEDDWTLAELKFELRRRRTPA
jgi:N-acylneuraminate cytidylyltransferase